MTTKSEAQIVQQELKIGVAHGLITPERAKEVYQLCKQTGDDALSYLRDRGDINQDQWRRIRLQARGHVDEPTEAKPLDAPGAVQALPNAGAPSRRLRRYVGLVLGACGLVCITVLLTVACVGGSDGRSSGASDGRSADINEASERSVSSIPRGFQGRYTGLLGGMVAVTEETPNGVAQAISALRPYVRGTNPTVTVTGSAIRLGDGQQMFMRNLRLRGDYLLGDTNTGRVMLAERRVDGREVTMFALFPPGDASRSTRAALVVIMAR